MPCDTVKLVHSMQKMDAHWSRNINLSYTEFLLSLMEDTGKEGTATEREHSWWASSQYLLKSYSARQRRAITSAQWLCSPPSQFPRGSLEPFNHSLSSACKNLKHHQKKKSISRCPLGAGQKSTYISQTPCQKLADTLRENWAGIEAKFVKL